MKACIFGSRENPLDAVKKTLEILPGIIKDIRKGLNHTSVTDLSNKTSLKEAKASIKFNDVIIAVMDSFTCTDPGFWFKLFYAADAEKKIIILWDMTDEPPLGIWGLKDLCHKVSAVRFDLYHLETLPAILKANL